ncbi:hypothetical protein C4573_06995 [Candidatus Woesearchaeota archaeon]|nr:MAG: hypothetical protein C4573_06995 [Candidatus Woesearchaeota archaeon]
MKKLVLLLTLVLFLTVIAVKADCYFANSCNAGDVAFIRASATNNAHAELRTQSTAGYQNVCCPNTWNYTCTIPADRALKLQAVTNSHVQRASLATYANDVCIKGVTYYTAAGVACNVGDDCVLKMSGSDNAHIADCTAGVIWERLCVLPSVSPSLNFQCTLSNVTIKPNCANCNVGANISLTGYVSGNCSNVRTVQVDARNVAGTCVVNASGGDIAGLRGSLSLGNDLGNTFINTSWLVPAINADCQGQTVNATVGFLFNNTNQLEGETTNAYGGLTFAGGFPIAMRCGNVSINGVTTFDPACNATTPPPSLFCGAADNCVYGNETTGLNPSCYGKFNTRLNEKGKSIWCSESNYWCPENYDYNPATQKCEYGTTICDEGYLPPSPKVPQVTCNTILDMILNTSKCFNNYVPPPEPLPYAEACCYDFNWTVNGTDYNYYSGKDIVVY